MKIASRRYLVLLVLASLVLLAVPGAFAQDDGDEAMTDDSVGVTRIVGEAPYTVGFLTDFNRGAINVVMSNVANQVDRAFDESIPTDWQVLGLVTTDPYVSPFEFEFNLPVVPPGPFRDVDNNGEEDTGVKAYVLQGFINFLASNYWDTDYEYSTGFNSFIGSTDFELRNEIIGGKMLVWAPDDAQSFPSGFGEDLILFSEDDPVMSIPAGWSVVDLGDGEAISEAEFTIDRPETAQVDLIEAEQSLQPADYTALSYTEAFDALIEQMRNEYSFTELKGVDWDALYDEFAPRFAEAEENDDPVAYQFALRDFSWSIPDGHIGASLPLTNDAFFTETDGGLGLAIRELDDGTIIASFVQEGSPAAEAGVEVGTEITGINGEAPLDRADDVNVWSSPFSTDHSRTLQELRYVTRFEVGEEVELSFINADGEEETATLTAVAERASWSFSSVNNGSAPADAQPITFDFLEDSGYGYIQINSFSEYPEVMFRDWEWIIDWLNDNAVPGVIIDMRWNGGGYNLYNQMVGYFTQEEIVVGNDANFYPDLGDFFVDPLNEDVITPPADGRFYGGDIAVLVSPACASACEYFSYNMSLLDQATLIGFYPTDGLGGNITPVFMPDDVYFQFTIGRSLDAEGDIRLEGLGAQPDVIVPVTEDTFFYEGDVLLDTAVEVLNDATTVPVTEGGEINVGDNIVGELTQGERIQYTFTTPADGGFLDFVVDSDDPNLDTVLNIYLAEDLSAPAISNDDDVPGEVFTSALREIEVPGGLELVIEIQGFEDASSGPFSLSIIESMMEMEEDEAMEEEETMDEEESAEEEEEAADDSEAGEEEATEEEPAATEESGSDG